MSLLVHQRVTKTESNYFCHREREIITNKCIVFILSVGQIQLEYKKHSSLTFIAVDFGELVIKKNQPRVLAT